MGAKCHTGYGALLVVLAVAASAAAQSLPEVPDDLYQQSFEQRVTFARMHPWTAPPAQLETGPDAAATPRSTSPRERFANGIDVFGALPEGVGLAYRRVWAGCFSSEIAVATTLGWIAVGPRLTLVVPRVAVSPSLTVGLEAIIPTFASDAFINGQIKSTFADARNLSVHLSGTWLVALVSLVGVDAIAVAGTHAALHMYARGGVIAQIAALGGSTDPRGQVRVDRLLGLDVEAGAGVLFP